MRYVRYAILGLMGILLLSFSMANRETVLLQLMPDALAELIGFNFSMNLPLFLVILGGVAAGVLIGFVWEWIREHRHRKEASVKAREVRKLEREVGKLKTEKHEGKDEVLAILDEAS
jgi:uncharacterized integral membrane protein